VIINDDLLKFHNGDVREKIMGILVWNYLKTSLNNN
jgi:hypothetical protein